MFSFVQAGLLSLLAPKLRGSFGKAAAQVSLRPSFDLELIQYGGGNAFNIGLRNCNLWKQTTESFRSRNFPSTPFFIANKRFVQLLTRQIPTNSKEHIQRST